MCHSEYYEMDKVDVIERVVLPLQEEIHILRAKTKSLEMRLKHTMSKYHEAIQGKGD